MINIIDATQNAITYYRKKYLFTSDIVNIEEAKELDKYYEITLGIRYSYVTSKYLLLVVDKETGKIESMKRTYKY